MLQYCPETKTLTVAHQDFRIKDVYIDDGIYCLVPKDPNELLFITNGRRIIRAHNFEYGRGMFIRYLRSSNVHPKLFTLTLDDEISAKDAVAVYLLITSACMDGVVEWLSEPGVTAKPHKVRDLLEKTKGILRADMVVKYFTEKDDFSRFTPHIGVIPNMEPQTSLVEDYV